MANSNSDFAFIKSEGSLDTCIKSEESSSATIRSVSNEIARATRNKIDKKQERKFKIRKLIQMNENRDERLGKRTN